jgi:hypothetical protein
MQKGRVYSLTAVERYFVEAMQREGYTVHRAGWPDFFVVGRDPTRAVAVEIKGPADFLKPDQKAMHAALGAAGLTVTTVDLLSFRGFGLSNRDLALLAELKGRLGPARRSP